MRKIFREPKHIPLPTPYRNGIVTSNTSLLYPNNGGPSFGHSELDTDLEYILTLIIYESFMGLPLKFYRSYRIIGTYLTYHIFKSKLYIFFKVYG